MSLITKIQYVFNKILLNFVKEIKDKDPDLKKTLKENYAVFDKTTDSHINLFIQSIKEEDVFMKPYNEVDILTEDSINELEVLKNIKVGDIYKVIDSTEKEVLKCYLYILYMLSNIYDKTLKLEESSDEVEQMNELFNKCMKMIRKDSDMKYENEVDNIFDDEIVVLFKNIFESRKHINESIMGCNNEELDGVEEKSTPMDFLEGSKIGQLAKEITQDIEIDKLNIKDPSELLNVESMFSGENNVLGDIISKVGNKVASKINSGELKHEDLLSEAMSMMGKLNMGGGANPFIDEMMKTAMSGNGVSPNLPRRSRIKNKKK